MEVYGTSHLTVIRDDALVLIHIFSTSMSQDKNNMYDRYYSVNIYCHV